MSTDYAEKEREFIASLEADTGRDLAGWMNEITRANLPHRNDIIDWLRTKGFPFAKASWLERIHHNGGRLIYADDGPRRPAAPRRPRETPKVADAPAIAPKPPVPPPAPSRPARPIEPAPPVIVAMPPPRGPAAPPLNVDARLNALLAKAKAYRPLAQFVLNETHAAIPAATFEPQPPQIVFLAPQPFAELVISSKDVRLCFDFGMRPLDEVSRQAGSQATTGRAKPFPHVIVLTDARQITAGLIELLREAAARSAR
jgi:hypothetical protein